LEYTLIYKTKEFISLTKKEHIKDDDLVTACSEMNEGLHDADLGGNVYKKRIASKLRGKRSGYRVIIGANIGDKYFLLFAFAKNTKANINTKEKLALKELAHEFLSLSQVEIEELVKNGELSIVGKGYE